MTKETKYKLKIEVVKDFHYEYYGERTLRKGVVIDEYFGKKKDYWAVNPGHEYVHVLGHGHNEVVPAEHLKWTRETVEITQQTVDVEVIETQKEMT